MPFEFQCPQCGGVTNVSEEFAGQRGPCIHCGREVEIPAAPVRRGPRRIEDPRRRLMMRAAMFGLAIVAMIGLTAAVIVVAIPVWKQARSLALERQSASNLRKIGLALRAYESDYGCYPPAYIVDSAGTPLLSWRVLILPYLGEEHRPLFERFDKSLAWNAPQNMMLLREMPDVFVNPADDAAKAAWEASYLAFVGPQTMFPSTGSRATVDIRDDRSSTIVLIETSQGAIRWTQPQEIDVATSDFQVQGTSAPYLGGANPNGAQVLFADGEVDTLPPGTNAAVVEAMTTVNGGEAVGR